MKKKLLIYIYLNEQLSARSGIESFKRRTEEECEMSLEKLLYFLNLLESFDNFWHAEEHLQDRINKIGICQIAS